MKQIFWATFAWLAVSSWSVTAQTITVDPYNGCRMDSDPVLITGIITPPNGAITVFDHVGNDITVALALQFRLFRNTTTGEFSALLDGLSQSSLEALTYTIRVTSMSQSAQEVIVFRRVSAEIIGPATVPPCAGSVQMLLSPTTPSNGVFSGGTWITTGGIFDPANAGEGTHAITYSGTYEGCDYTTTFDVVVTAATTGEYIFGVKNGYCASDDAVSGNVAPLGGDLTLNGDPVSYDATTGEFSVPIASLPSGNNVLQYVIVGGCSETKDFTVADPGTVVFSSTIPNTACVGSVEPFFMLGSINGGAEQPLTTGFFANNAATYDSVNGYYVLNTNQPPGPYADTYVFEYNFCTYTYNVSYTLLAIAPSPANLIRDVHYTCEGDWIQINQTAFTDGGFVLYNATTGVIVANSAQNPNDIRNVGGIFSIRKAILVPGTNYRLVVDPISGCYEDKTFGFEESEGPSFGSMPTIYAGCPATIPVSPADGVLSYYVEGILVPIIDNTFTAPAVGHYVLRYETACNYVEYIVEALGVEVSISGLLNAYYDNVTQVVMTGNPTGGTFSGTGVSGNIFSPQTAGEGYHIITYTYQTETGCVLSATRGVQVVRVSCNAPSGLSASNVTQNSALLSWNALVPNPTFYQVRYKKVGATSENFVNVSGATTSLSVTGLMPNTTYQFRVRAFCNGAFTAFSSVYQFTTQADAPCTTPTSVSAVVNGDGSVGISWSPSAAGQSYDVEITYPDGLSGMVISAMGGSVTVPPGLAPGTYSVSVTAVCNPGLSAFTSFVIPDAPVCNPVSNLAANLNGNLVVSFTPPASGAQVSGYRVEIVGTGLETTVSSSPASLNVSSLDPGTYTVRVTTLCVGGGSSAPQTTSFEKPAVDCSAVPFISSITFTSNSATVRWGRLPNAVAYEVHYRSGSTVFPVITVPQTGDPIQFRQITGLTPSTSYAVKVRAICNGGVTSGFSAERRFTTLAGTGLREAVEWDGESFLADVSIYPNPTKGISHLSFVSMESGTANLAVYDMRGAVVVNRNVSVYQGENQISLDLSDKSAGMYIVKLVYGESVHTVRLAME